MATVFVGHDWAEDHHDIHIENSEGKRLHHGRLDNGLDGVAAFHAVVAEHADSPADVLIASETDRGLFITALIATGYEVIAINPMSTARYRERLSTSGEVRRRGRAHAGRGGPAGRSQSSSRAAGLAPGRCDQAHRAGPSEPGLDPPAATQPAAVRAA